MPVPDGRGRRRLAARRLSNARAAARAARQASASFGRARTRSAILGSTRQLLPASLDTIARLQRRSLATPAARHHRRRAVREPRRYGTGDASRAAVGRRAHRRDDLAAGDRRCQRRLGGRAGAFRTATLHGTPFVADTLTVPPQTAPFSFTLRRHAHSFFQGNRFLLEMLVGARCVHSVPAGACAGSVCRGRPLQRRRRQPRRYRGRRDRRRSTFRRRPTDNAMQTAGR